MPKLLFVFLSLCIIVSACKKEDCECYILGKPSTYDPDFVVFPTKEVFWVIKHWKMNSDKYRIDSLFVSPPVSINSRKLPSNAIDYSIYEPESAKLYYSINSKYYRYTYSNGDTTSISGVSSGGIYTYFRVDTAENKLYELYNGPDAKYEIELIDWDKQTGDTLYNYYNGLGTKNAITAVDSILLGNRYLKTFNTYVWQGSIYGFRHTSPGFFGVYTESGGPTTLIYKNETIKVYW